MDKEDWMHTILLIAAFFLQSLVIKESFGAELSQNQAVSLYAIAYGSVGHLPNIPPKVVIAHRDKLCDLADMKDGCPVRGLQLGDTVYLDETLDFDDPLDASIALHEFSHYVQWAKLGPAQNCKEWLEREEQAYTIQMHALNKIGVDFSSVMRSLHRVRQMRCL